MARHGLRARQGCQLKARRAAPRQMPALHAARPPSQLRVSSSGESVLFWDRRALPRCCRPTALRAPHVTHAVVCVCHSHSYDVIYGLPLVPSDDRGQMVCKLFANCLQTL